MEEYGSNSFNSILDSLLISTVYSFAMNICLLENFNICYHFLYNSIIESDYVDCVAITFMVNVIKQISNKIVATGFVNVSIFELQLVIYLLLMLFYNITFKVQFLVIEDDKCLSCSTPLLMCNCFALVFLYQSPFICKSTKLLKVS